MEVEWCGEHLLLLPERAVWWPRRDTLLIADLHLGKDATFRHHGIPIPSGVGQNDLDRLSRLLSRFGARRLVILGDLIHARSSMTAATRNVVSTWRADHRSLEVLLIRGNHDRSAGDPPEEWDIVTVSEPFQDENLLLCHVPPPDSMAVPVIAGHLHPAVTLSGPAGTRMTLPCFWMRPWLLVLPAFTSFAGRPQISAARGDRIFVTGDEEVVEVP